MNGRSPYHTPYMPWMSPYQNIGDPQQPAVPSTPTPGLPSGVTPPVQPPVISPVTGRPLPTGTGTIPPGVPYQEGGTTVMDPGYIQAYLARNIGRYAKIEFILGTNMLVDREGTIIEVGTNYVVLQEPQTDDLLMCDLYSIKFVKTYY
ncbi:MAG: hypothetical protein ACOX6S_10260 [Clostridia bacterium]|jgi:hypothetical protein